MAPFTHVNRNGSRFSAAAMASITPRARYRPRSGKPDITSRALPPTRTIRRAVKICVYCLAASARRCTMFRNWMRRRSGGFFIRKAMFTAARSRRICAMRAAAASSIRACGTRAAHASRPSGRCARRSRQERHLQYEWDGGASAAGSIIKSERWVDV